MILDIQKIFVFFIVFNIVPAKTNVEKLLNRFDILLRQSLVTIEHKKSLKIFSLAQFSKRKTCCFTFRIEDYDLNSLNAKIAKLAGLHVFTISMLIVATLISAIGSISNIVGQQF